MANSKPRAHLKRARVNRAVRLGIQLLFLAAAPSLFSGAFNGVKYLFAQMGASAPLEATSFLILLVALLAYTVVFGRFFCGYACAFGTLGDVLFGACEWLRVKAHLPRPMLPPRLVKTLSMLKYVVLFGICAACFAGVWANVSGYSPWVAFAGFIGGSLEGVPVAAFVLLALVMVGMVLRERFFCQFLCPLGAIFTLLPVLGFSEFTRTKSHCARSCGRCQAACPVDVWPDAASARHGECISCGRCADECPLSNVNLIALERKASAEHARKPLMASETEESNPAQEKEVAQGTTKAAPAQRREAECSMAKAAPAQKPVRKTREGWHLLRGTEIWLVIAKAALLLGLCWMLGATRYLPVAGEVIPWLA